MKKQPVILRQHAPNFTPEEFVILRTQFLDWSVNELVDYILRTLPFDQKKTMLNNLTRNTPNV